ncbi:ATP-dependent DNA helicase DinG [Bacillus timonensis]|nr:ATP-dependent DNA helicase DinG [Bacillus timonensis]
MFLVKQRFAVIDIETTGNSPKKGDKIIQFAAVVIENGEIIQRFTSFVNPKSAIPTFIEQFTGISDSVVKNAPDFSTIAPEIVNILEGAYFVAHNVPFDLSFLQEELSNNGFQLFLGPTIDTVELARIMLPWADSYKLGQLAEDFSITHDNPHRADSDAEVTAELLLKMLDKMHQLPLITCQKLLQLSKYFKSDIYSILQDIVKQKENISSKPIEYEEYRGIALNKLKDSFQENTLFNESNLTFGKIKQIFDKYTSHNPDSLLQKREGQQIMMDVVNEAMESNQHAMIEAGTGLGKSLAYLLPAIVHSKKQQSPIVISTHTIQLQQQLLEYSVPLVEKMLSINVKASLLKGKNNYLCLNKFEQSLFELEDNYDVILTKAQLLVWLTETNTGDVAELNLSSGGKLFWDRVKVSDSSKYNFSSHWESKCFYSRAVKMANKADIIITNHSLLFSDFTKDSPTFPLNKTIIIDEAHHIEEMASKSLGEKLDYVTIHSVLSRLGDISNNRMISKIQKVFNSAGIEKETSRFDEMNLEVVELRVAIDDLFRMLHSYAQKYAEKSRSINNQVKYHYSPMNENRVEWEVIVESVYKIKNLINRVVVLVDKQYEQFNRLKHRVSELQQGVVQDYFILFEKLQEKINILENLLIYEMDSSVYSIEIDRKGAKNSARIFRQPTGVSEELADRFYAKKNCVIMTSATLTVNHSFDFFIERLGLGDFLPLKLSVQSPFNYEHQMGIMVPSDLPKINEVGFEEFVNTVSFQIAEIAIKTNGRMLILFTSYEMLNAVNSTLKEFPFLNDFIILAQSESGGSRARLTRNFKAFKKSILLGTSSFWEGVDIPGKDLTVLVIVRLPFTNPNDPVFIQKCKRIQQTGQNPFYELALPEAVLRFKQGIGRLIRTEQDKGVIFILDRRILTEKYGSYFINSLPKIKIFNDPLEGLLKKMDDYL